MFFFRQALRNLARIPGRTILIGIVIFVVSVTVLVSLSIEAGAKDSIIAVRSSLGNEVRLQPNMQRAYDEIRQGGRGMQFLDSLSPLTKSVADLALGSGFVTGYDYSVSVYVDSGLEELNSGETGTGGGRGMFGGFQGVLPKFSLMGNINPRLQADFLSGEKYLTEGRFYDDSDAHSLVAVIDALVAQQNELAVGSTFAVWLLGTEEQLEFEVIGIYEDTVVAEESVLPVMMRANTIYVPFQIAQTLAVAGTERDDDYIASVVYYLDDPANIEAFREDVVALGMDLDTFTLDANDAAYQRMIGPMERLGEFAGMGLLIVVLSGALIMLLLMTIITRERKQEIGILRALGVKRWTVARQFIAETLLIAMVALLLGTFVGGALSQNVADAMLDREIAAQEASQAESSQNPQRMPGGRGEFFFQRPGSVEAVSDLDVVIGWQQILRLIAVALGICMVGSFAASYWIMKYEPMEILISRN